MIHSSHSKKDLIEIIEYFEFNEIEDFRDKSKVSLQKELWEYVRGLKYIHPDRETFFVEDVSGLIRFLQGRSPKQLLTQHHLEKVSLMSKNIIFYCRECSYSLPASNYDCIDEIIENAIEISQYGDLPMVRRALRLLNEDEKIEVPLEPIMTKRVMKKIKRMDDMKKLNIGRLKVTHGKVMVLFD
tara:strand:- start:2569 stop:3123 length:555 start_codon:yes stop_codon:yes gene_type:complete